MRLLCQTRKRLNIQGVQSRPAVQEMMPKMGEDRAKIDKSREIRINGLKARVVRKELTGRRREKGKDFITKL